MASILSQFGADAFLKDFLPLFCSAAAPKDRLEAFFEAIDYEDLHSSRASAVALLAAKNDYAGVRDDMVCRLQGMRRYASTLNAGTLAAVKNVARELSRRGMTPVLVNDTAIRVAHSEAVMRPMWQGELGVPSKDYRKAVDVLKEMGFDTTTTDFSCVARRKTTENVIVYSCKPVMYMWSDPELTPSEAMDALLPGDMALLMMHSEFLDHCRRLGNKDSYLMYVMMDVHPILSGEGFDRGELLARANEAGVAKQVGRLLDAYDESVSIGEDGPFLVKTAEAQTQEGARERYLHEVRGRLRNGSPSIISSNCIGGMIAHDLKLQHRSPTINTLMAPEDFLTFLEDFDYYLNCDIEEIKVGGVSYPAGVMRRGDEAVRVDFVHYSNFERAVRDWRRRADRVDAGNLYVILQVNGIMRKGSEIYRRFKALPFEHKRLITRPLFKDPEVVDLKAAAPWSRKGKAMEYKDSKGPHRHYDDFDYVSFLNEGH